MSPLELPGRSFGYLPDRRNCMCPNCGDSFRNYVLHRDLPEMEAGIVELACPFCDYKFEHIDETLVVIVEVD